MKTQEIIPGWRMNMQDGKVLNPNQFLNGEKGVDLQSDAQSCLPDERYSQLKNVISSFYQSNLPTHLGIKDEKHRPDELNALIILLHQYGFDNLDSSQNNMLDTPGIMKNAYQALRPNGWNKIGGNMGDVSGEILKNIGNLDRVSRVNFDVSVITALSCGNVETTLTLLEKAENGVETKDSLTRLANKFNGNLSVFEKAYELLPEDAQFDFDFALATIAKNHIALQSEAAEEMQNQGIIRLQKKYYEWYLRQKVSDGSNTSEEVANLIAGELQARIHPELLPEEKIKYNDSSRYSKKNRYENFFQSGLKVDNKKATIDGIHIENGDFNIDELLKNPNLVEFKHLVLYLKSPDIIYQMLNEAKKNKNVKVIIKRLRAGITFLDTIAKESQIQSILQNEFGLGDLISEESMQNALSALSQSNHHQKSKYDIKQENTDTEVARSLATYLE